MSDTKIKIVSFRDLKVWDKAMSLSVAIYQLTSSFPDHEKFGFTNQLRRASVSVPSNIVEGFARDSRKEFQQFLRIAKGSVVEIQVQIELAFKFGYVDKLQHEKIDNDAIEISKMLASLIRSLEKPRITATTTIS